MCLETFFYRTKQIRYAQTLILVYLIIVKSSSCLVITFQGGGVTTCKFDRIIPLILRYPPIRTMSRNEEVRPQVFSPEVFKKKSSTSIEFLA